MSHLDSLETLFKSSPKVTHQQIIDLLWADDPEGGPLNTTNNIKQHIYRLRKWRKLNIECTQRQVYRLKETDNAMRNET